MNIKIDKEKLIAIDSSFLELKKDNKSTVAVEIIKKTLDSSFDTDVTINIVSPQKHQKLFVMSIFPENSTLEKIIANIMSNETSINTIKSLWEKEKKWTIEIDKRILDSSIIDCTERELTAILLHEIGHVICTNSIPTRVATIIKYETSKAKLNTRMAIRHNIFHNMMSLPILDACISDGKRDKTSIKNEIKADGFAKKLGYQKDLSSALTKLSKHSLYPNNEKNNKEITSFMISNAEQYIERKNNLSKKGLLGLKESCSSPFINDVIDNVFETFYNPCEAYVTESERIEKMCSITDSIIDNEYCKEFFLFGKTNLKKIDQSEIDYVDVRIQGIKSVDDKMLLVSYINSKIDMIDFYISILQNPKTSKKYSIPQSIEQLNAMKAHLLKSKENVLAYKIPERDKNILVSYPKGYEG